MHVRKFMPFVIAVIAMLGLLSGMAPHAAAQDAAANAGPLAEGYILGPGDVVEVGVAGREEYKARVQVQPDGTVQLPFLRDVRAKGLTVQQFQSDVAARLKAGGYYVDPVVNAVVAGYASRYVVVLGEVARPGLLPIDRDYRLSEIVARAGGITASGSQTVALTRESGEKFEFTVEQMATGATGKDPYVAAGDKVYVAKVEEAEKPVFYIYGQVNAPGSYPVAEGMSVRMALARGGGLTPLGSEKKVAIFREGVEVRGMKLNDPIQVGDVVKVGERFF